LVIVRFSSRAAIALVARNISSPLSAWQNLPADALSSIGLAATVALRRRHEILRIAEFELPHMPPRLHGRTLLPLMNAQPFCNHAHGDLASFCLAASIQEETR
jgi:hypothetical protein